jgi:hypothetical protein
MADIKNLDSLIDLISKKVSEEFKTSDSFDVKSNKLYSFMQNLDITFKNAANAGGSIDIRELDPVSNARFTIEADSNDTPYVLTEVLLRCSLNGGNTDSNCVKVYENLGKLLGKVLNKPSLLKDPKYLLQWNILGTIAAELRTKQMLEKSLVVLNNSMKTNHQLLQSNLFSKK